MRKRNRLASGYTRGAGGLKQFIPKDGDRFFNKPAVLSGSGGLFGTATDYARFLMMIAGGGKWGGRQYLKPESVKRMTSNQLPPATYITEGSSKRVGVGFGFGFRVRIAKSGPNAEAERIGEYGWSGAASTHFWVSPNDDQLVVVTMEQTIPWNTSTEMLLKPVIYDAFVN